MHWRSRIRPRRSSIAWPQQFAPDSVVAAGASVRVRFALPSSVRLLLGVDRLDYTKGIVERLAAFERLLETYPHLLGQVTLLQIAAPTRIELDVYRRLEGQVRALAGRINDRFGAAGYAPVSLQLTCHDTETLAHCYMAADACLVTSLHDGMNLVAKEFVAARSDNGGVLVLSEFTGAARELREALVVNPYSCEAMAAAMAKALAMPRAEQARRMRAMRATVSRHTVFGWAATLLSAGVTRHAADGAHGVKVSYRQPAPVPYQWQAAS